MIPLLSRVAVSILLSLGLSSSSASAQEAVPSPVPSSIEAFSDVPPTHIAFEAVEYLKAKDVITGYPDGTFQPDRKVNRAEAAKIIVAPRMTQDALAVFKESPFDDVPAGVWSLPYIEAARQIFGFVDGPPKKTTFKGENPVLKVEFLKMLLTANSVDPNSFGEIRLPLSPDVTNPDEWYYPYLRYALSASMTMADEDGLLQPGKELTRGEVALLLHRFLMYRENRRTQALLSAAESEIVMTLTALERNDIVQAEYAAARGLLAARGAHASRPEPPIVRGALKITEAFGKLVQGYRAGLKQQFATVIERSKEAWSLADQAIAASTSLQPIAEQVKTSASTMAESARELKGQ